MMSQAALSIAIGLILGLSGSESGEISMAAIRQYLNRLGVEYRVHPENERTLVIARTDNRLAVRVDLYVELREDDTLVLTAYAREDAGYFNLRRAARRQGLIERLLKANHRSFVAFFVDDQEDIGVRFTFTTENGVGFESFSVALAEVLRVADAYVEIFDEYMRE